MLDASLFPCYLLYVAFRMNCFVLEQGLQTFLSEGHISYYTTI